MRRAFLGLLARASRCKRQPPLRALQAGQLRLSPFDAYAGAGAVKHNPSRSVTVLKPASYAEVERIAKALKAGDVVVLALRNTPDQLAKRILDFCFGLSYGLDGDITELGDRVFAVTPAGIQLSRADIDKLVADGDLVR